MPLPDLIEISPVRTPLRAEITVPGSKSITNRALVLAALGEGETELRGALWSEDTQVMVEALQQLGFLINLAEDPAEPCNRHITVYGKGGHIPPGGSESAPLELFVGNAGTAARFLAALVCLGRGHYRLSGVPRMHERPQVGLFRALRELGYHIISEAEKLPAVIEGGGPRPSQCRVSIAESSQFASALLLCAHQGKWQVTVTGMNAEESPYVAMTSNLVRTFPRPGGTFQIEPDASSAAYFWGAGMICEGSVKVTHWPTSGWQIDQQFPVILKSLAHPPPVISRTSDLGDSIMMAIVLAPFAGREILFTDLGRLRVQECERVQALRTELTKCGARIREEGDRLRVSPSSLHGAEINTYGDHRLAMCFAILGLKVPGLRLQNPACVKKTFPNFFQTLALPGPRGIGAVIHDARPGAELGQADLFAD
jgi:3-phosphoshikimate 1-carboxyvinyltransferase